MLLGAAIGLFYDVLRSARRRFRSAAASAAADAVFWLAAAFSAFMYGLKYGGGQTRLFMLLAMAGGAGLYFLLLSPPLLRFLSLLASGAAFLLRCAAFPFSLLMRAIKKFINFLKKLFISSKIWYKIKHGLSGCFNPGADAAYFYKGAEGANARSFQYFREAGAAHPRRLCSGNSVQPAGKSRYGRRGKRLSPAAGRRSAGKQRRA
ncbi:MAG: spore cortex biosynthesis protein YabQ [Oscillospiraceae bacterium]|nr:spore cortex biosynthesis protein YabQ [Oscillospiraceae bacterium]